MFTRLFEYLTIILQDYKKDTYKYTTDKMIVYDPYNIWVLCIEIELLTELTVYS